MAMTSVLTLPPGWVISSRLMPAWQIDAEHMLELEPAERTDDNRIRWRYRLSRRGRTIFEDSDIRSPVGAVGTTEDLLDAARSVLNFLTVTDGDTEYFADYTQKQRLWSEQYAEDLSAYAMDGWCGYCGGGHLSPGCVSRRPIGTEGEGDHWTSGLGTG
ncbi:hypothetical protein [Planotetraspora sp. GP83]|uniref:hypothetical protein n=1 Tax=Planotetraspora sp. GP83 TaxID=3156264 RepID=UPI0035116A2C